MLTASPFSTHLAPLAGCVAHTEGPVIELGSGMYSTSLLHAICQGRELVTVDNSPGWLDRFRYLENEWHQFVAIENWEDCPLIDREWAVALVDQAPAQSRVPSIKRLRARTSLIVVHDSQADKRYGADLAPFRYRADYFEYGVRARTTVLSDLQPIPVSLPDLTANHVSLGLELEDVVWNSSRGAATGLVQALPPLPHHFYLTGFLEITGAKLAEVEVVATFRTDDPGTYFSHELLDRLAIPPWEALVVSENAEKSGTPSWDAVTHLEIVVRTELPDVEVRLGDLDLKALSSAEHPHDPPSRPDSPHRPREKPGS